jgi:two-component system, sensor histidine kinase
LKQHIRELGHVLMNKPVKPLKLRSALNHLLRG